MTSELRGSPVRIGLALSGGSVRGLAHIGVIRALSEAGIEPAVIAGTSAGSLVGAALAAGADWSEIAALARSLFWPSLLVGRNLERFCEQHLPETFAHLRVPFAAVATALPSKRAVALLEGPLATAISASCAMRVLRRSVFRDGLRLRDGGIACVLPAQVCRQLGADFVIGSDVWEVGSLLRRAGLHPSHPSASRLYPQHYGAALRATDLLIQPEIPAASLVTGPVATDRMIEAGQRAARRALAHLPATKATRQPVPAEPPNETARA